MNRNRTIVDENGGKMYAYTWPRPGVAVDLLIFAYDPQERDVKILLGYREDELRWGLIGRFIRSAAPENEWGKEAETIYDCIEKMTTLNCELIFPQSPNETAVPRTINLYKHQNEKPFLIPLEPRDEIERDKGRKDHDGDDVKYRIISLPFICFARPSELFEPIYKNYRWVSLVKVLSDNDLTIREPIPPFEKKRNITPYSSYNKNEATFSCILSRDHKKVFNTSVEMVRQRLRSTPFGREMLDDEFRMLDLQMIYQCLLGRKMEASNFRKSFVGRYGKQPEANVVIISEKGKDPTATHRPADMCRFNHEVYDYYCQTNSFAFSG